MSRVTSRGEVDRHYLKKTKFRFRNPRWHWLGNIVVAFGPKFLPGTLLWYRRSVIYLRCMTPRLVHVGIVWGRIKASQWCIELEWDRWVRQSLTETKWNSSVSRDNNSQHRDFFLSLFVQNEAILVPYYTSASDVPRSLQSWVSTILNGGTHSWRFSICYKILLQNSWRFSIFL